MAPIAATTAPSQGDAPPAMPRHEPESRPMIMRALRPTGAVRAGALGSWSATNSTSARMLNRPTAHADPMKANGEPERLIHPRWAAHATTAGAVRERRPVTRPIPKVIKSTNPELMKVLHQNAGSIAGPDRKMLEWMT